MKSVQPRRRIVRRAVMALTGAMLLVFGYVGSYLALQWCSGRGALTQPWRAIGATVYLPLDRYCETDLSGAKRLRLERVRWHLRGVESWTDHVGGSGFGGGG